MTKRPTAGGIFVNYRQNDCENRLREHSIFVEALFRRLVRHFGEDLVFLDTSMRSGTRYPDELRHKLDSCDVLLAVIHANWLDDLRQRQDRPDSDWVLFEISTALAASSPVIPVLLGSADLPSAHELPEPLRELAQLRTFRVHSGSVAEDVGRLVKELEKHVPPTWRPAPHPGKPIRDPLLFILVVLLFVYTPLSAMTSELGVVLLLLSLVAIGVAAVTLLVAAALWLGASILYRMEKQLQLLPATQYIWIFGSLGSYIVGMQLLFYYAVTPAVTYRFIFMIILLVALLLIMALIAREIAQEREWPSPVLTHYTAGRKASLRRAMVHLDQRLCTSWRPPLSRVQRDQALHIVEQLRTAAVTLRQELRRGRLDWLRAEHRRAVIAYGVLLAGTVALAIFTAYLLADREAPGWSLFLVALTPVCTAVLCWAAMELFYRQQRRERRWFLAEIETSLRQQLLPQLSRANSGQLG